jgi:hypothetical protein
MDMCGLYECGPCADCYDGAPDAGPQPWGHAGKQENTKTAAVRDWNEQVEELRAESAEGES